MSLSKTLVSLGTWIEKHFPEKLTAGEVHAQFRRYEATMTSLEELQGELGRRINTQNESIGALVARIAELEKQNAVFTSDMNKTKIMLLTQRQTAGR